MPRNYKQLSPGERDEISVLKAQGMSLRNIAQQIGRHVSTISRELNRNAAPVNAGYYLAHKAQERADARKAAAHERPRLPDPNLRRYLTRMLRRRWSPERIAGRWQLLGNPTVSHEAIYQWVYADARNLVPFLARSHRLRLKRRHTKKHRAPHIPSRTPIAQRPEAIRLRQEAGHWEGDTIIGKGNKSALQILVERKTRFTRLIKLPAKNAESVRKAVTRALGGYPNSLRRTITYDNGSENTKHESINKKLGTKSFFCDPMCSWQKGGDQL